MDVSVILRNLGTHPGKRFIKHMVLVFLLAALAIGCASAEAAGMIIENGMRYASLHPMT